MKKILISAKCLPTSRRIIRNSKYTYGDAVDYFAKAITNKRIWIQNEIKITKNQIRALDAKIEENRIKIKAREEYIEYLKLKSLQKSQEEENDPDIALNNALKSIKQIADTFNCSPLEIDQFTGEDTIGFHAKRCGLSRSMLENLILERDIT